jgi:multiple sugar transport system ATP-binding protein
MSKVRLENVSKHFGDVIAVRDFNLSIEDREFIVLVGPSGCGKTTTLRMVAGLETITSGNIYIRDRLINRLPPKERDIAMVFQNYALYPHMTVFENMAFGLEMRGTPKDEIRRRVYEAAQILGIEDLLDRKPKQLSGGQRQRVAVGRAIVRKPEVFLFDEPLSNLDAKLRVQTRVELKKLHERLEATAIYVTHDQVEAMTMGDRIVVMNEGVIQQVGSPLELYNYPKNKFVASFIGSPAMNFFEAELRASGEKLFIETPSFRLQLPERHARNLQSYNHRRVIVGIRPEDLMETAEHVPGRTIEVIVEIIEPIGSETYIDVKAGEIPLVARVGRRTVVRKGQNFILEPIPERVHIFDMDTEEALVRHGQE